MPKTDSTPAKVPAEPAHYVKGLEGIVAAQTALSLVDGEASQLYYRGIPVHEFIEGSSNFEEVVYLLWNGKLPLGKELEEFEKALAARRNCRTLF